MRKRILAFLVLGLFAAALTACGVGAATDEEKVSKTATTYLRALADGDTAKACAQLTPRAQGSGCEAALKERLSRLDPDALKSAADGSMNIDVDGDRATAGLSEPGGARFLLAKVGGEWRIDSGYTLGPAAAAAESPATPVGEQVAWALAQLNSGAAELSEAEVSAHFAPEFLAVVMPASELVASLAQTGAERGPFTFTGFAYPPTATRAVALIETKAGERGSLRIEVESGGPARITRFEVDEAPPVIESRAPTPAASTSAGVSSFSTARARAAPPSSFRAA